jgi:parallel beta-helix repeat protein
VEAAGPPSNAIRCEGRDAPSSFSTTPRPRAILNNHIESGTPGGSGIFIQNATNCLVSENTVRGQPANGIGIGIESMSGCKLFNNVVSEVDLYGIYIDGGTNDSLVWKNVVSNSGTGILVEGSNNQIEGNVTNGNSDCGLVITGTNNVYRGNTARANANAGSCAGACAPDFQTAAGNSSSGDNFVPGGIVACQ